VRIAVLSDTHVHRDAPGTVARLLERIGRVDYIIHAGDYASVEVIRALRAAGPFAGVWGNVDPDEVREEVPAHERIELAGYRIGIVHGHGTRGTTPERAFDTFRNDSVDIVVFGHSHQPSIQTRDKVLLLNPGSPTDKRRERWFSYIVLDLLPDGPCASLHFFRA
jgi:putative phosphoesterase